MTGAETTARGDLRRYDLDWLRVIAFGLLIFYHVGMFYVTWDWHIKSRHASPLLEMPMALVNPWRLGLLFFISGVAIRFASDRVPAWRFGAQRLWRLLLPLVFGMLVIVPPQTYLELRAAGLADDGAWTFYRNYLSFAQVYPMITPTWNHLWYVAYVLVYTLVLLPFIPALRRLSEGPAERWMSRIAGKFSGSSLLALPLLPFAAYELWLVPRFPETHALVDDWANHAGSFTMLLVGFMLAKSVTFWRSVERALPLAIGITIVAGIALAIGRQHREALGDSALWPAFRLLPVLYAWSMIVSLLGLGQKLLDRPSRALSYLTQAIFPYYILHQTIIILVAYPLIDLALPAWAEASVIVMATVVACATLYEFAIRRMPLLCVLFGLKFRRPVPRLTHLAPATRL